VLKNEAFDRHASTEYYLSRWGVYIRRTVGNKKKPTCFMLSCVIYIHSVIYSMLLFGLLNRQTDEVTV